MQSDIPKQYLQLNERYLIDHTIERCLTHPGIDGCYVALSESDVYWADSEFSDHPDIVRVEGGSQRADSVLNALPSGIICWIVILLLSTAMILP